VTDAIAGVSVLDRIELSPETAAHFDKIFAQ
jgi:hypothetical protein